MLCLKKGVIGEMCTAIGSLRTPEPQRTDAAVVSSAGGLCSKLLTWQWSCFRWRFCRSASSGGSTGGSAGTSSGGGGSGVVSAGTGSPSGGGPGPASAGDGAVVLPGVSITEGSSATPGASASCSSLRVRDCAPPAPDSACVRAVRGGTCSREHAAKKMHTQ